MTLRRLVQFVCTLAIVPMLSSCKSDAIVESILCELFVNDVQPNGKAAPLTELTVGGTGTTGVTFGLASSCTTDLNAYTITAVSLDPTVASVTKGTVLILPSDDATGRRDVFVPLTVGGVGVGATDIRVTLALSGTPSREALAPVQVNATQMTMGTAAFQFAGLPSGVTGNVRITGNGVDQVVTQNANLWLMPGSYNVTVNNVETTNNDYADPQPSRQVMVIGNQTTNIAIAYAIVATLVNINFTGLEAGLSPMLTLTRGAETRSVTANTALKLAIGVWTIALAERTIGIRSYRARSNVPATLNVLPQSTALTLALAYYCYRFQWQVAATFGIFSDPFGHAQFVNLLLTAHLLNVLWLFPEPAGAGAGGALLTASPNVANQVVTQETVTITGVGAFVPVTGTRAANGALNLTGSGTVAGFPNVPVAMTGTLSSTGAFTAVQYRMGQSTAPTGLPNGPIIYSMSAPAPSSPMAAVLREVPRTR